MAAASPARGGSGGQEQTRAELPQRSAGENGVGAHQPRTEAAEEPDCPVGRAEGSLDALTSRRLIREDQRRRVLQHHGKALRSGLRLRGAPAPEPYTQDPL